MPLGLSTRLRALRGVLSAHQPLIGRIALQVAAAGSIVLLVLLVHRAAYTLITKSPEFRIPRAMARATVAPAWADPASPESVVLLPAGRDTLMDPDLVSGVAASFASNPWVRRVVAVERAFPDQIRV